MFNEIEQEMLEWLKSKRRYSETLEEMKDDLIGLQERIEREEQAIKLCDEKIKELKEKL